MPKNDPRHFLVTVRSFEESVSYIPLICHGAFSNIRKSIIYQPNAFLFLTPNAPAAKAIPTDAISMLDQGRVLEFATSKIARSRKNKEKNRKIQGMRSKNILLSSLSIERKR